MSVLGQLTQTYIPNIRVQDIFEILIIVLLIYKIINGLKNTRAMLLLKGVLILFVFYNIMYILHFEAIVVLFQSIITILLFALIIVFQPELRKFLEKIGTNNITGKLRFADLFTKEKEEFKYYSDKSIVELSRACFAMGEVKTGALIVIERDIPLTEYVETGIRVGADLTYQLLINIFEKNTPLHDGAVIQKGDKVDSATCYLPLSHNPNISKKMGTRHRAAIGVSEMTDAVVIVVSEETGDISIVVKGEIISHVTKEEFNDLLYKYQKKEKGVIDNTKSLKKKFSLRNIIYNGNWGLKLVSLLVGFITWVLLINVANPVISKEFNDIPIQFINTSVIEDTGKTFELLSEDTVSIKITDKRKAIDSLKADDIVVIADFSKLSYVNAVPLEGRVNGYPTATVQFLSDSTIIVELDSIISREVPLTVQKYSNNFNTYYIPELVTDSEYIVLSGGKTKIDTIDKVVVTYNVSNAKENYEGESKIVIFDKNGEVLPNDLFDINVEVVKAVGVGYPIKTVPLNVVADNTIVEDYQISEISFEPLNVRVAGNVDILSTFDIFEVVVPINVSVDSLVNNEIVKTISVSDQLPEGIFFADNKDEIVVTFVFEVLETKKISFYQSDIEIIGLDSGKYTAILGDTAFSITISGDKELLENLSIKDIGPYIDVSDLDKGNYNLILQYRKLDNLILKSNISVKLYLFEQEGG